MRLDRFTERSQEALQAAQQAAQTLQHPTVDPEHLLLALLEQPEGLVFFVDLPGVAREDVTVSTNAVAITVRGRRQPTVENARPLSAEAPFGVFARQLALPPNTNSNELTATLKNGVLELKVPRVAPSARPITVQ